MAHNGRKTARKITTPVAPERRSVPDTPVTVIVEPTVDVIPSKTSSVKDTARAKGAITGTVTSTRGRGLRGIEIRVVAPDEDVVASVTSGAGGRFAVENLPAGTYRLSAADPDGDFAATWVGGTTFAEAKKVKLSDKKPRREVELQLVATAAIAVEIVDQDGAATLRIRVTDRGTGIAAGGVVHVATKLIGAELPLAEGQVTLTLQASSPSTKVPKKIVIDYRGDEHTAPATDTATLR